MDANNPLTVEVPPGEKCSDSFDRTDGLCFEEAQRPQRFTAHGAIVGGPKTPTDAGSPMRIPYSLEGWNDWRMDWIGNEQALDFNAAYTMALAQAIELPASFWIEGCDGARECFECCTCASRVGCRCRDMNFQWKALLLFGPVQTFVTLLIRTFSSYSGGVLWSEDI